ncbi:hypothetical protein [Arthrobacter sp. RAF14]|uniref:hypothetical protein n=1 Tax=Arthrobacter sp. RAF14 TaxID=3233051 RepID=UPI003F90D921
MAYELNVYSRWAVSGDELCRIVERDAALGVGDVASDFLQVTRGVSRRRSFSIDGPENLSTEDVPEGIVAVVLGARFLYSILADGSSSADVQAAIRFSRRLARATDGAVVDDQMGEVWSRSSSRRVQRPERSTRVSTIDMRWFALRENLRADVVDDFLKIARRELPEALPRRYGEYEPFQGRASEPGDDGFVKAWKAATGSLYFTGSGPCVGGHIDEGPQARFPDKFWSVSLTFLVDPILGSGWVEALRRLFVKVAEDLPAFYSSAEVTGGHIWSGRSLSGDTRTEPCIVPVRHRKGWMGLPPKPVSWAWLGQPFETYFGQLPTDRTTTTGGGMFYASTEGLAEVQDHVPLSRWLPSELFAEYAPNPYGSLPVPLIRAREIPSGLE